MSMRYISVVEQYVLSRIPPKNNSPTFGAVENLYSALSVSFLRRQIVKLSHR